MKEKKEEPVKYQGVVNSLKDTFGSKPESTVTPPKEKKEASRLGSEDFPIGNQADANMAQPSGSSSEGKRKRMDSSSLRNKSKSDEESMIEVTDDEDSPSPALCSGSAVEDHTKLLEFPPDGKDRLTVTLADFKTLEHDTFLNDIIIDFYLQFLHDKLPEEDKKTVHIFSTMFYKRLNMTYKKSTNLASFEKDPSLSIHVKRHLRVKGWTKHVDLFEKVGVCSTMRYMSMKEVFLYCY